MNYQFTDSQGRQFPYLRLSVTFAKFPNGNLFFGLPGNPISAAIGLRFFVSAALTRLLGLDEEKPLNAILANELKKKTRFSLNIESEC